jgi:hypothetical protein
MILPARAIFHFERAGKQLKLLERVFAVFFQMRVEIVGKPS